MIVQDVEFKTSLWRRMDGIRKLEPVIIFSMALYAIAFFLTQLFHEFGHAVVGSLVGSKPVMYTAYVEHQPLDPLNPLYTTIRMLAGSVFSLVQGILFLGMCHLFKKTKFLLFLVWMSYHGIINFIGYCFIGSFVKGGDIGKIWIIQNAPVWLQIGVSAVAFGSFFFLPRLYSLFFAMSSPEAILNSENAKKWGKKIGLFPGLLATPLIILVTLPLPHIATLIYISSAFLPLFILPRIMERNPTITAKNQFERVVCPVAGLAVLGYLFTNFVGRFIFDNGIAF